MKQLLVIDDTRLRQEVFREAAKILAKMDRLENQLATYMKEDQRLFSDWYDLTFRQARTQLNDFHEEYLRLARYHNDIIAIARMLDLEMPQAWAYLRDEEARFRLGDADEQEQIRKDRQKREDFAQDEMRQQGQMGDDFTSDEDGLSDGETPNQSRSKISYGPPRTRKEEKAWQALQQNSDDDWSEICRERSRAYEILWRILELARTPAELQLLVKVWDQIPAKHQKSFSISFQRETGQWFPDLIDEIDFYESDSEDESEDHDEDEIDDQFLNVQGDRRHQKSKPEMLESLKTLYRQLVRRLHPDRRAQDEGQDLWEKKIWNRVQEAYKKSELSELQRIWHLVVIRSGQLRDLAVSEVLDIQRSLQAEHDRTAEEIATHKKQPAWGFSRRKDFAALERKLQKSFDVSVREIKGQIAELQTQHQLLEVLADSELNYGRGRKRRKKPGRKASGGKKASRQGRAAGRGFDDQESFFDEL